MTDGDMVARVRAATALRRLGHAIVSHDVPASTFDAIASQIEEWLPSIEAAPGRSRSIETMKQHIFERSLEGSRRCARWS